MQMVPSGGRCDIGCMGYGMYRGAMEEGKGGGVREKRLYLPRAGMLFFTLALVTKLGGRALSGVQTTSFSNLFLRRSAIESQVQVVVSYVCSYELPTEPK